MLMKHFTCPIPRNVVWGFNKRLPEFSQKGDSLEDAIKEYNTFRLNNYSLPLKLLIDDVYYDLNVPIDIVNLITMYNSGGIVYNYSKRFQEFSHNTIYLTPIMFGYIETFLFLMIFIGSFIGLNSMHIITILLYAICLIIHTICALISYYKCKKYEMLIRNFKRSLYNNDIFIQQVQSVNDEMDDLQIGTCDLHDDDEKETLLSGTQTDSKFQVNTPSNDWQLKINQLNDNEFENKNKLVSTILSPTNNSFAYIAYQRWSNVKILELSNDGFTRSKSALCLALIKYWFPAYLILSGFIIVYAPVFVSIIWGIVYIHSYYVMLYCYYRVIMNVTHRRALRAALIMAVSQDILIMIIVIAKIFMHKKHIQKVDDDGDSKDDSDGDGGDAVKLSELLLNNILIPMIYALISSIYILKVYKLLRNIILFNLNTCGGNDNLGAYLFWMYNVIIFASLFAMCSAPSYLNSNIAKILLIPLCASLYMNIQKFTHQILTGLNKIDYVKENISNNPKLWLKTELKLLFISYAK